MLSSRGLRLDSEKDFKWYQAFCSVSAQRLLRHEGQPEIYPCLVVSDREDDQMKHHFIYSWEAEEVPSMLHG